MLVSRILILLLLILTVLPEGCSADNAPKKSESHTLEDKMQADQDGVSYVKLAKDIVKKYELTQVPSKCLLFNSLGETQEYKAIVDVRELHNKECRGDEQTSPRLFSIAFDRNNKIWSDAKSLLGQMEPLD